MKNFDSLKLSPLPASLFFNAEVRLEAKTSRTEKQTHRQTDIATTRLNQLWTILVKRLFRSH